MRHGYSQFIGKLLNLVIYICTGIIVVPRAKKKSLEGSDRSSDNVGDNGNY